MIFSNLKHFYYTFEVKNIVEKARGWGGVLGIWADTYARFEVWPTHPSIYQNILPRPIHLPIFCQFLLLNSSIYQNLTQNPIHLPFLPIFAPEPIYLPKILRSNPSIYQNFTLFLKMTHPSIYIGLIYIDHMYRDNM